MSGRPKLAWTSRSTTLSYWLLVGTEGMEKKNGNHHIKANGNDYNVGIV